MGILGNLFKPKSQSEEDAKKSTFIMERLKAHRGAETGKWLALMEHSNQVAERTKELAAKPAPSPTIDDVDNRDIIDEAPYSPPIEAQYLTTGQKTLRRTEPSQAVDTNETVEWVNKLFAEFTRQSTDYNASAAGTQLDLTVHPPAFKYEAVPTEKKGGAKKMSVFKGHVATLHWAMLVQGCEDKIDVYVIAADEILNFTLNDIRKSQLSPFMTIASTIEGSHRLWSVGGTNVSMETIALLAKELLGDLIRIATGTMSEAELFADHATNLKLGETVAHGYAPQQPVQQFEQEPLPLGHHQFAGPMFHQPEPFTAASAQQNEQPFAQADGAAEAAEQLDKLSTWSACEALIKSIDKDLAVLTSTAGALDPEKDKATAKRLHDLSAVLRTLSGQVASCLAEYHPAPGSKYNAS